MIDQLMNYLFPVLDKPENVILTVNDSNICKGDIISVTCSADGKPDVHTYQLFENDTPVPDSDTAGVWQRTMSAQGSFTYRCVANNTVGKREKNVTVTVNGNWYLFFFYTLVIIYTVKKLIVVDFQVGSLYNVASEDNNSLSTGGNK